MRRDKIFDVTGSYWTTVKAKNQALKKCDKLFRPQMPRVPQL